MALLDSSIAKGNLSISGALHTYKLFINYQELTVLIGAIKDNKTSNAVVSAAQVVAYVNSLKK